MTRDSASFGFTGQIAQFLSLLRMEFHNIIIGKAFLMMALIGLLQVVVNAVFGLSSLFGTEVYPTTPAHDFKRSSI